LKVLSSISLSLKRKKEGNGIQERTEEELKDEYTARYDGSDMISACLNLRSSLSL